MDDSHMNREFLRSRKIRFGEFQTSVLYSVGGETVFNGCGCEPANSLGAEMNKLCIFLGLTIFGWIGWWLGKRFGLMTGYLLSFLGSLAGVYVGWRVNRHLL